MKLLIGVVGENGAGKSSLARRVPELAGTKTSVEVGRFSAILGQTLDMWGIDKTRRNLQELPRVMEIGFGQGVLSRAARPMIEQSKADIYIMDGVRWWSDYELIRSFETNLIIYVTADTTVRFDRLRQRGEKHSETAMSRAQFDREERAESELQIPAIGAKADIHLLNNGSNTEFIAAIDQFFQQSIRPLL